MIRQHCCFLVTKRAGSRKRTWLLAMLIDVENFVAKFFEREADKKLFEALGLS